MTLVIWHRSELTEEFGKLRRDLSPSLLASLVQAGLVPVDESQPGPARYSALALVPLLQAQASAQPLDDLRLPREVRPFLELQRGVTAATSLCIQRVEQTLVRCASLGLLVRQLPDWDAATLESLRGDARLEWRLHQLMNWLRSDAVLPLPAAPPRAIAPSLGLPVAEPPSGSGWTVPAVPTLAPVFGSVAPSRPAPAVSASFAERLARISASVGKPVVAVAPQPAPPAVAPAPAAAPLPILPKSSSLPKPSSVPKPSTFARPASPLPLPKRAQVEQVVAEEVDWGFEQVAPSSSPAVLVAPVPASSPVSEPVVVVESEVSTAPQGTVLVEIAETPAAQPDVVVAEPVAAPVEAETPAMLASVAVPSPWVEEPAPLKPSVDAAVGDAAGASDAGSEASGLVDDDVHASINTAVSTAFAEPVVESAARRPAFEIAPELYEEEGHVVAPEARDPVDAFGEAAVATETVWSESAHEAAPREPAEWELAVDAVRRLNECAQDGALSAYAEAMAANAVAACLACEVYEVEPDLLQFADDASLEIVELVWLELEPELASSARAELAVRFGERLSRRRDAAGRTALRKQIAGVCRVVLNDAALAYELLTDRFATLDITREECDLLTELAEETANQSSWSELLERTAAERPELAAMFSAYRLAALERVGDMTGVADALERTLSETTDQLTYLALLRRTMTLVEEELGDLHRAAELARTAVVCGRFDDRVLGELDRLYAEAWRFEELFDLLLEATRSEPAGSLRLAAVLRRAYYLARDHFSDPVLASRKMVDLLLDSRNDAAVMLGKIVLPEDYEQARREADALRELALVRAEDAFSAAVRVRAAYLYAVVLSDDQSGAEQLMAALPLIGDEPELIRTAEQVMLSLTRSTEYGADAVAWLVARAHAYEDRAAGLAMMVSLLQLPLDAALTDEARAELSEDIVSLADDGAIAPSDRAAAHLAVARAKRSAGAVRTAAYHAVQAAENASDDGVDEQLFADALGELGELGGSSLRAWGGDEVSARALFSNHIDVLRNFGRLCSEAGAWTQAARAYERLVPLLRAAEDASGLTDAEACLDRARQQLAL